MKFRIHRLLLPTLVSIFLFNTAHAFGRYVIVNGQMMGPAEIAYLTSCADGEYIPDGRYWLDYNTGAWGYEGGYQQGVLNCEASEPRGKPSWDEMCAKSPEICSPVLGQ